MCSSDLRNNLGCTTCRLSAGSWVTGSFAFVALSSFWSERADALLEDWAGDTPACTGGLMEPALLMGWTTKSDLGPCHVTR